MSIKKKLIEWIDNYIRYKDYKSVVSKNDKRLYEQLVNISETIIGDVYSTTDEEAIFVISEISRIGKSQYGNELTLLLPKIKYKFPNCIIINTGLDIDIL